ncbi:discoidin domain-containing protein [Cohnella terricola]|uniref:Discoidin domain-containing protein n=1 Tax=Cohnella terricola TaxID=1289167 RepID=A0A559JDN7_9BACL|nr:discoidin domain-containing protein [Cohnella terricola]TVX97977.1 discoidin domain-containing protein [Cohnella terricola]
MANGKFAGGDGSNLNPFLIEDAFDLDAIRKNTSAHYKLVNNINMDVPPFNIGNGWTAITTFSGTLNGQGYHIDYLLMNYNNTSNTGFIATITGAGASITNLGFKHFNYNFTGSSSYSIGIICNRLLAGATIDSCYLLYGSLITDRASGGFVSTATDSTISNCYAIIDIDARATNTALVASTLSGTAKLINCFATSYTIKHTINGARGICSNKAATSTISNCYYNSDMVPNYVLDGTIPLNTSQCQTPSSFVGFESVIWLLEQGKYPSLQVEKIIKYLFSDGNKIITYKNNAWQMVGTSLNKSLFDQHGMDNIYLFNSSITNPINELNDPKVHVWTRSDYINRRVGLIGVPYPRLVMPLKDLDIVGAIQNLNLVTFEEPTYSNNLIPKMTSNTAPSGIVSASSITNTNYAWYAFDRTLTGNGWVSSGSSNQWISFNFLSPKIINKYTLVETYSASAAPKDWTFEGSNDGANWSVLDTRTNIIDWSLGAKREFVFPNNISYSQYRIFAKTNNGNISYVSIGGIEMMSLVSHPTIRVIASKDQGVTWESLKSNSWQQINISNLLDVKANGMTATEFNAITQSQWGLLSTNKIRLAYYLEQININDVARILSLSSVEDVATETPIVNSLTIYYDELDKKYSGLMFMDTSQQYYSTSIGDIIKYLDFGTLIAGQSSLDVKIILTNTYPFDVKNLRLFSEHNINGLTIEFSKTNAPFITESELLYPQTLGFDQTIEFHIRLMVADTANSGGNFDIRVESDPA